MDLIQHFNRQNTWPLLSFN